jgi:flagellar basal body rod protein FlgC
VDLPTETVQGMGFDIMYRANLQVLNTADELMKTTMDMKA